VPRFPSEGGGSRVRSFRQEPGHSSGSKASNTCGQKVVSSINHLPGCLISRFPKKWSRVPKICATLNYPRRQGGSHFSYRLTSPRTKTCRVLFNPLDSLSVWQPSVQRYRPRRAKEVHPKPLNVLLQLCVWWKVGLSISLRKSRSRALEALPLETGTDALPQHRTVPPMIVNCRIHWSFFTEPIFFCRSNPEYPTRVAQGGNTFSVHTFQFAYQSYFLM